MCSTKFEFAHQFQIFQTRVKTESYRLTKTNPGTGKQPDDKKKQKQNKTKQNKKQTHSTNNLKYISNKDPEKTMATSSSPGVFAGPASCETPAMYRNPVAVNQKFNNL